MDPQQTPTPTPTDQAAPPSTTGATPPTTPQQPAAAPPEQAKPGLPPELADVLGMAEGATLEELVARASELRALETKATKPEEPKPAKKEDDGTAKRFEAYAKRLAATDLAAELASRGFSEEQRKVASEMLSGAIVFDEETSATKTRAGLRLSTAVDQLVTRYPSTFKAPAAHVPTPPEPPPPGGEPAPNGRRLAKMENLRF